MGGLVERTLKRVIVNDDFKEALNDEYRYPTAIVSVRFSTKCQVWGGTYKTSPGNK
jgi:hypothetical protein